MGSESLNGFRRSERVIVPISELLGDDAEVEMKRKLPDALMYTDSEFVVSLLNSLNCMRKSGHFCDVVLQVGFHSVLGHRCVLATMSQHLAKVLVDTGGQRLRRMNASSAGAAAGAGTGTAVADIQLNGHAKSKSDRSADVRAPDRHVHQLPADLDVDAVEALVDFAYTGKLCASPSQVRKVYCAAIYLRVEKVVTACGQWLVDNLDVATCLEVRAMKGVAGNAALVKRVDAFIKDKFDELVSEKLLKLTQLKVELLTSCLEPMTDQVMTSKALLVLDWLRTLVLDTKNSPLDYCANKLHLLYQNLDNKLHDCTDINTDDRANTELVRDYKKLSKKLSSSTCDLGQIRCQSQCSDSLEILAQWTVIACSKTGGRGMVALITVQGQLCVLSLRQRLNTPSPSDTPVVNWPPTCADHQLQQQQQLQLPDQQQQDQQQQQDHYVPLPELSGAKCATGVGNLNGRLIICGGYDRGECLRDVEVYDPATNTINALTPMQAARGRFDLTVVDGRVYAVGGCDGNNELTSVEVFTPGCEDDSNNNNNNSDGNHGGTWKTCAPLTMARSNTAVCALNGKVYCVGGWNGKFGSKKCEVYDPERGRWYPIASLSVGRYQAAVTALDGMVYAVGGCDSWNCLSSVEAYDPASDRWVSVPPMSTPRRGAGVSKVHNKLIVIGGSDGVKSLNSTEIYHPERREWTAGPKMTSRRANVNVAAVAGKIFAVGGFSGKSFLNTMEYLDCTFMCWNTFVSRRPATGATTTTSTSTTNSSSNSNSQHSQRADSGDSTDSADPAAGSPSSAVTDASPGPAGAELLSGASAGGGSTCQSASVTVPDVVPTSGEENELDVAVFVTESAQVC